MQGEERYSSKELLRVYITYFRSENGRHEQIKERNIERLNEAVCDVKGKLNIKRAGELSRIIREITELKCSRLECRLIGFPADYTCTFYREILSTIRQRTVGRV